MRQTLALVAVVLAGCGAPQQLSKQAQQVHSVAAEGALLAHDANRGSHGAFTREHAQALRKLLDQLRPAIANVRLAHTAAVVDQALSELARDPGNQARAGSLERRLGAAATAAETLAR